MGNILQGLDPETLLAQQDATQVAGPESDQGIVQQLEAPGLLSQLIQMGIENMNTPKLPPIGEPIDFDAEATAELASEFGPIGDIKGLARAPGEFAEGHPIRGIVELLAAAPGLLGLPGDLLRSGMKGLDTAGDATRAANMNRSLAQRTGSIAAPEGSEVLERQAARVAQRPQSILPQPSELFQGLEGLDAQGLRVFAKPGINAGTREIVSLTPNPKQPGGWKATIFEEVEGQGHTMTNTVDFATHDEALAALNSSEGFFGAFSEIAIGSPESMEQIFRSLLK